MAVPTRRNRSDLEIEVEIATEEWIPLIKGQQPVEWEAWTNYRKSLGINLVNDKLTVPTSFPPTTLRAAQEYVETLKKMRRLIGWAVGAFLLPAEPHAWMGEI